MKKVAYKFLGYYLRGDIEVKTLLVPLLDPYTFKQTLTKTHYIYSGTGNVIFSFILHDGSIKLGYDRELCETVSGYLGIHFDSAKWYIREWFFEQHKIGEINEFSKFIPAC